MSTRREGETVTKGASLRGPSRARPLALGVGGPRMALGLVSDLTDARGDVWIDGESGTVLKLSSV